MKWIKADADNLPKPKSHTKANIRYKGNAELLQYINGIWHWYNEDDKTKYPVTDEAWLAIEFLDEKYASQQSGKWTDEDMFHSWSSARATLEFRDWLNDYKKGKNLSDG